jgi:hypothetical protein
MKKTLQAATSLSMCTVLLVISTGCSAFVSPTQTMDIQCNPGNAVLLVNGQRYTPPAHVTVRRNREVSISAEKDGYFPYTQTIGYHFNTTGALDAVGTALFLVPAIGLFTPGAWSLDETSVTVSMVPKQ